MEKENLICFPGQKIHFASKNHLAGTGTYERLGYIYSNLLGTKKIIEKDSTKIYEVKSLCQASIVPSQGDIVTAKVVQTNPRMCKCIIKCIRDNVLIRPLRAVLKKEDVRATEKDKVDIYKCFKVGDIILARVLPITELHLYYLSTAENELGVAIAKSEAGVQMVPISWSQMQCPKTLVKEFRKVAKITPENLPS